MPLGTSMLYKMTGDSSRWWQCGEEVPHGITGHLGRSEAGNLQLERLGPAIPAFTIPSLSRLIVTESIRTELEAEFHGISFLQVEYANVVRLNWHEWDPLALMPEKDQRYFMPDLIMDPDESDDTLIEEMPPIYELVPEHIVEMTMDNPELGTSQDKRTEVHFFDGIRANQNSLFPSVVVSETAKAWIESRQSEWLQYHKIPIAA